ncbi:MAG: hypothetical protein Q4D90_08455 [bacterium]|nr:hypothetical protein [bacterium]
MRKRKRRCLIGMAVLMLGVTACGGGTSTSEFTPSQSSIYVSRDGKIQSALVQSYDADYYSEEELREFLTAEIDSYNQEGQTEAPVELSSCSLENGTASAIFSYGSTADFLAFAEAEQDTDNELSELSAMKVADALAAGLLLDAEFVKAKDASAVDAEKITRQSDLNMVASSGGARIQTEGKVQYLSKGCTLVDDFTVQTPEEGRAYIIFK